MSRPLNARNLSTLIGVAILVGVEIFGVAFAGGWAIAGLFELGDRVGYVLMGLFGLCGAYVLWRFMQNAVKYEPVHD